MATERNQTRDGTAKRRMLRQGGGNSLDPSEVDNLPLAFQITRHARTPPLKISLRLCRRLLGALAPPSAGDGTSCSDGRCSRVCGLRGQGLLERARHRVLQVGAPLLEGRQRRPAGQVDDRGAPPAARVEAPGQREEARLPGRVRLAGQADRQHLVAPCEQEADLLTRVLRERDVDVKRRAVVRHEEGLVRPAQLLQRAPQALHQLGLAGGVRGDDAPHALISPSCLQTVRKLAERCYLGCL
mmetsp:Transcript_101368/g.302289  ORF Transcript_101368/g.302289 Transcript_101368/m.302289 type:complete len:242 (+) Transcript_101368:81-806(+)